MDVSEETKLCPNCKHQISSTNFSLHTVHCQRSLILCTKCDEAIPRTSINEHMETAHKEVACPLCRTRVENCQLEHHQSELCSKRLIKCEYCEVNCHAGELQEHEAYCGSRTELCETCGQYILIKDEAVHIASGHAPKDRNRNKQDNVVTSKESVESAFKSVHANRPKVPNVERDTAARQSPTKRSNDMPQINTRASLNTAKESEKPAISDTQSKREALDQLLALHLSGEFDDIDPADVPFLLQNSPPAHRGNGLESFLQSTGPLIPPDYDPDVLWDYDTDGFVTAHDGVMADPPEQSLSRDTDPSELIPCEFCGDLITVDYIVQHESGCRPDLVHGSPREELNNSHQPFVPNLSSISSTAPPITSVNREPVSVNHTDLPISPDDDMIPCEICGEHYPSVLLDEHQSICPATEFGNVRFDLPEADRNLPVIPLDTPVSRNEEPDDNTTHENHSPMASDDLIPCEICEDHFPSDVIIEHQNFCANFKEPIQVAPANNADVPLSEEQTEQKENVPVRSRIQIGVKTNPLLRAIESKQQPSQPSQHVKFGALPNTSIHRQPRVVNSSPSLNHYSHQRVRNVPISVASDYHHPSQAYGKNNQSYFKNSKTNLALHSDLDSGKSSSAVNSYMRETRKALNPVKEALLQETARQNVRNSGTGTRPKNQTTVDDSAFGTNRPHQPETAYSRYSYDAKRRDTEPSVPSYLRNSAGGNLEEAFKTFLANRGVPSRIGHSAAPVPPPRSVTHASGDRRSVAARDNSRLPPIVGMGAVPKKKERNANDECKP